MPCSIDITWTHRPCRIDISQIRYHMALVPCNIDSTHVKSKLRRFDMTWAAKIETTVISILAAPDLLDGNGVSCASVDNAFIIFHWYKDVPLVEYWPKFTDEVVNFRLLFRIKVR